MRWGGVEIARSVVGGERLEMVERTPEVDAERVEKGQARTGVHHQTAFLHHVVEAVYALCSIFVVIELERQPRKDRSERVKLGIAWDGVE